ncbi:MAG: DUF1844 domain-containing protein [Desulfobacterales bacterium]|nr:DUF1844 domain-containing protein [Desulfobacterales bacterium]
MAEEKGFTIKDRRLFSGESEGAGAEPAAKEGPQTKAEKEGVKPADAAGKVPSGTHFPKINFSTFIFSLNASALVQLGIMEDPSTGEKIKNMPLAKQTIDIIGMLDEKTRGNLTEDEEKLSKNILHDLRLMYVKEKG